MVMPVLLLHEITREEALYHTEFGIGNPALPEGRNEDILRCVDERDFFTESPESKKASYTCPKCRTSAEYSIRWIRRTKRKSLSGRVDDMTRAKFAKSRDHLVRVDDMLSCQNPNCRQRFEIPSFQSIVFI
jgi:hypothetical protein